MRGDGAQSGGTTPPRHPNSLPGTGLGSSEVVGSGTMVELDDIPGGACSFELAARFCYVMAVELTAGNISGLRCAEEGNLMLKTEAFLSYVVLSSWRESVVALRTCGGLSPWTEDLQIVRRCSDSIAWKACANRASSRS